MIILSFLVDFSSLLFSCWLVIIDSFDFVFSRPNEVSSIFLIWYELKLIIKQFVIEDEVIEYSFWFEYIIIFLLVIGFISYGGEIHDNLKNSKNMTWLDVIMDTEICRLKDRKSFFHYLKIGLVIKI